MMKEFLLHIGQSSICLALFGVVYTVFLRKTTFFKFNRFFLLFGIVAAGLLPFFQFSYDVFVPYSEIGQSVSIRTTEVVDKYSNYWDLLFLGYLLGVVVVILRNAKMFWQLNNLRKTGEISKNEGYKLIDNFNLKTSFSILKQIYMNTEKLESREKELILKHEISHIEQKHWIDLICGECALMLQWFNPLVWYYVYLQKENHEYLADQAVLKNGESIAIYQAVLINQRFQGPVFSFANSFNYFNKKNRLTMMKKTKTSPWKKIAVLALVPLFGGFFALSAKPNYVNQSTIIVKGTGKTSNTTGEKPKIEDALIILDGVEITHAELSKIDPSIIFKIEVTKDPEEIAKYGEKAKNGIVIVTTKK